MRGEVDIHWNLKGMASENVNWIEGLSYFCGGGGAMVWHSILDRPVDFLAYSV